ncbi:hypothetical protein K438DRAFT_2050572 [Mycena galopus ATCC 62051]|nr:hypothetical protein K438DRAFT_2050572 [Mycena galopus ATCC 62051]
MAQQSCRANVAFEARKCAKETRTFGRMRRETRGITWLLWGRVKRVIPLVFFELRGLFNLERLNMQSNQSLRDRFAAINTQITLFKAEQKMLKAEQKIVQKKLQSVDYPVLALPIEVQSNQILGDRLAAINARIPLLEAERKIVWKELRSVTYPVLSLPFEVTSEIFLRCLPDLQDSKPIFNFSRHNLPMPLLLSQVCRDWRDIVFKTPRIWAMLRISIQVSASDYALLYALVDLLMLEGSKNYKSSTTLPMVSLPIFSLSNQWQNLGLRLLHSDLVTSPFSDLHGRLPILQDLQIRARGFDKVVTAFEIAPSLRRVILDGLTPALILLPWTQLTYFSGEGFTGADCLQVLRLTVSLVECKLAGIGVGIDGTELLPPHFALKVLHLEGHTACRDLLRITTLPSLVELDYTESSPDDGFVAFLSRSSSLLRLSLQGGNFSRILNGFPFLLDLTFLEISPFILAGMSDFWHNLGPRGPANFLPKLESLVFSVWLSYYGSMETIFEVNYGDLVDTVEFRWNRNNTAQLKSLRIKWSHRAHALGRLRLIPPPDFSLNVLRLQDLIDEGMRISITAEMAPPSPISEVWI